MREEDVLIYEPQEAKKREEELREEELRRREEIQKKDERVREEQRLRKKTEEECEIKIRNFAQERDDALKLLKRCKEKYAAAADALEAIQGEKERLEAQVAAEEQVVQRLTEEAARLTKERDGAQSEAQNARKDKSGNRWKKLSGIFVGLFALTLAGLVLQQNKISDLDEWNSRLLDQNMDLYAQCYFMDQSAGIVLVEDENDYYHTYSCETTQKLFDEESSFWIRNGNDDDDNIYIGDKTYTPCPLCH